MEIISPLLIQKFVLSINELKPTHLLDITAPKKFSFGNRKILSLCVINNLLNKPFLKSYIF
jgi:hypothetical protein